MELIDKLEQIEIVSSQILGKQSTDVFMADVKGNADKIAASFVHDKNMILVNSKYREFDYTIIAIIAHESRHAYQQQVINGLIPAKSTDDPKQWQSEFNNNVIPKDLSDDELKRYALRSIEIDANAYSELFLQSIKKSLKQRYPDWLRIEVDKRKKELEKELNFDAVKKLFN